MPAGWVAAAGAVVGGVIASQGAKSAADTQANAAMNAAQISQNQFNTMNSQEQPYMQAGYGAQNQLNYLLGIGPPPQQFTTGQGNGTAMGGSGHAPMVNTSGTWTGQTGGMSESGPGARLSMGSSSGNKGPAGQPIPITGTTHPQGTGYDTGPTNSGGSTAGGFGSLLTPFTADNFRQLSPAYQFQLQQGQQGVLNADASNAGALSGAAQKDLMGYNQSMADTSFNNAFNQYQTQQGNIYSRLAGVANLGQNAAANSGAQGTALAGQAGQSVSNAGSARAAGQVGAANAWSNAIGQASSIPWAMMGGGSGSGQPFTGGA